MQSKYFLRSALAAATLSFAFTFVACSAAPEIPAAGVVVTESDGAANAKPVTPGDASPGFNAVDAASATGSCEPPDMLLLLDRTLTMHRRPNGTLPEASHPEESKFAQAIAAIETLVAPPTDQGVRFGLTLWPKDPGAGIKGSEPCITLVERITNSVTATNPSCEGPEQVVAPGLGTGASIQAALDPNTTRICQSTPTGAALAGARDALVATRVTGREQNIVLVTDGADWDLTCPTPNPLDEVSANAAQGIRTFIVGFEAQPDAGTGTNAVGKKFLNDMACAGRTAKDFATACAPTGPNGAYRAVAPDGPTLYLAAETGAQLTSALRGAASSVCCNCIH